MEIVPLLFVIFTPFINKIESFYFWEDRGYYFSITVVIN